MREQGLGMGVTHWCTGGIASRILSADRRAVRIAKGYLGFITKGDRVGAQATMEHAGSRS